MIELRWVAIIISMSVSLIALIILYRERVWIQKSYRKELKQAVLNPEYVAKLHTTLEKDVAKHVANALTPFAKEMRSLVDEIDKESNQTIRASLQKSSAAIEQATTAQVTALETISKDQTTLLLDHSKKLQQALDSLSEQQLQYMQTYQQNVMQRVQQLVDEHAASLLANYLNASVQGVEFGDQQEFILERLEANKAAIKKDLAA